MKNFLGKDTGKFDIVYLESMMHLMFYSRGQISIVHQLVCRMSI